MNWNDLYQTIGQSYHKRYEPNHASFVMDCILEKYLQHVSSDYQREVYFWIKHQLEHINDRHTNHEIQYKAQKIIHDIHKSLGIPCPFHKDFHFDVLNISDLDIIQRYYLFFKEHVDDDAASQLTYLLDLKISTLHRFKHYRTMLESVLNRLQTSNALCILDIEEENLYGWCQTQLELYKIHETNNN